MLPLFQHQVQSLDFLATNEKVFDASDPGTGKTRVAIEAFSRRRASGLGKALVLAPRSLLRAAWGADLRTFAPHLRISLAFAENRESAFAANADVYITNHDATKWLARQPDSFFKDFDTLIIDEIGAYKHHTSQRSKALNKIKKHFKYRLGMNGTPSPNSITDIWHQIYLIDDGKRLGTSFFSFRQATCTPKQVGPSAQMLKWEDRPGAQEAVSKTLEDMTIRHVFEDCIDIPPNREWVSPFFLNKAHRKVYEEMRVAELAVLKTGIVTAINAAATTTKLLQIASGAVYEDENTWHLVDTDRYEMIMDLAEARRHSIVFFLWKHQKIQLIKEAEARGITYAVLDGSTSDAARGEIVDRYQKGFYRVLFAHPLSAAHGLTLTKGTATIWASPTYNLEHYIQGLRRIYRAGQVEPTETIVVVAEGTLEEKVFATLKDKNVRMTDLLELLKSENETGPLSVP